MGSSFRQFWKRLQGIPNVPIVQTSRQGSGNRCDGDECVCRIPCNYYSVGDQDSGNDIFNLLCPSHPPPPTSPDPSLFSQNLREAFQLPGSPSVGLSPFQPPSPGLSGQFSSTVALITSLSCEKRPLALHWTICLQGPARIKNGQRDHMEQACFGLERLKTFVTSI